MRQRLATSFVGAMALTFCSLAACSSVDPDPPAAVVIVEPASICEGDGFETPITIDGRASNARLTLVPAPRDPDDELYFDWSFAGAAYNLVEGNLTDELLTVTTEGDRPLHVTLRLENGEGGVIEVVKTIPLTLPVELPCTLPPECSPGDACDPCDTGSACTTVDEGAFCLIVECLSDSDCGPCEVCETDTGHCRLAPERR